jgi:formamidopyrimidine-DNA glycosylase
MPELPEVETIKNEIFSKLIGKHIKEVVLLWDGIVKLPSPEEFKSKLAGRKIRDLNRRGKYLLVSLNYADTLIIHLKMSGSLLISNPQSIPVPFSNWTMVRIFIFVIPENSGGCG